MVNLFEIGVNIFEETITALFMSLYFGCKYNDWRKYAGFLSVISFSFSISMVFTALKLYEGFFGLTYVFVYFVYALFFLKGNTYIKLFISGFINSITYFIALFTILAGCAIMDISSSQYYSAGTERYLGVIFTKVLLVASCMLLLKFKFNNILSRGSMLALIIMTIATMFSMVGIMQAFLINNELKNELLMAAASVMMTNVLTYYVFIEMNKSIEYRARMRAMKQKYDNDKKYTYDVEKLYSKTCAIQHDMVKHFETISGLLGSSEGKAMEYINSVMKNRLDGFKSLIRTDNEYFDAVANTKLAVCDKLGIKVNIRFMNHALDNLEPDEIGIIFGNLFDNAIEAVKNARDKRIELDIRTRDKRCSIMMVNSISGSVLSTNPNLATTKEDGICHGYGIGNIVQIVENHDGIIDFFEENNCFCCDILV